MVSIETTAKYALSFPETTESPHFQLRSFRVKKKIFATLDEVNKRLMVKLSLEDQSVFCSVNSAVIYPVPGGWGRKGATYIELQKINKLMLKDALTSAFCNVAPKKIADIYSFRR
jgi:hypothetical protein